MSTINISDILPSGSDLFSDSESYMSELVYNELDATYGGLPTTPAASVVTTVSAVSLVTVSVSASVVIVSNPFNSI